MLPTGNAKSNEHNRGDQLDRTTVRSSKDTAVNLAPVANGKNVSVPLNEIKVFSSEIKDMKMLAEKKIRSKFAASK